MVLYVYVIRITTGYLTNWTMFSGSSIAVIRARDEEGDPIVFSLDPVGGELLNIDNNGNLTLKQALDQEVSDREFLSRWSARRHLVFPSQWLEILHKV